MKPFLREVAEDLVQRFGEDLQDVAIVFNNKRPVAYLQDHLAKLINKPFWSPSFYTIQEFFALSSGHTVADPFMQFFTLFGAYNKLVAGEGGEAMDAAKFYPTARVILGDFAQIDNDLVNARQLFRELEDIAEIDFQFDYLTTEQQEFLKGFWRSYSEGRQKRQQEQFILMWRRMPVLYTDFHQALAEKGLTTMGNIYRQLAEEKAAKPEFARGFKKVVYVGFNALSKAEAVVFKKMQDEGSAVFYFDTDNYYLEDKMQEAGLFLRRNLKTTGLINALGENPSLIGSASRQVNVYQAQGHTAQAKIISRALEADYPHLRDKETARIAIIMADESLLLPVLQTIPTTFNGAPVDLNVTMGYPLAASSIFGLTDIWLTVQSALSSGANTVNFKEVEAFLSHPLTGISEKMRAKIQQKLIEEQLIDVPAERLQGQKGLFELFFSKVKNAVSAISTLQDVLEYVFEKQLEAKTLQQTEADLFMAVIKALNRLHDALAEHLPADEGNTAKRTISFVFSLIKKAMQGTSVPLEGEPLNGIQVMGLLESRNLDFDKIYILGANEGVLPQSAISPSFIPDGIRRAHGLPVLENQDAISAYMFYRLLHRATAVNIVYNAQADSTNTGEPTRFLRQLEYESGHEFNYILHQQSLSVAQPVPVIVEKDAQIMAILNKYLTGEMRLSASAITTYISCPLQFFYRYVARIEEPKEVAENVEANIIGLMLHWVMETFYRDLTKAGAEITKDRIAEKKKELPSICERAYARVVFNNEHHQVAHNGMQKVVLAIVAEYANIILKYDADHAPFTILDLEKKDQIRFNFNLHGENKTIVLHGIIDRIDSKNGVTRIVDYKTGGDQITFSSIEDSFDTNGKKQNKALLQTLFYTHVFEQANAVIDVEPNLYIVRRMSTEGTLFIEGTGKNATMLNGERLQMIKTEFIAMLRQKLAELFDETIPFTPTTNDASFAYSPYTTLCGR